MPYRKVWHFCLNWKINTIIMIRRIVFGLLVITTFSLSAQDSLRLTFKLEGFSDKDLLTVSFGEGRIKIPTYKNEHVITRKLDQPVSLKVFYKSRVKSAWIDNNDIQIYVSKSKFSKGINVQGSPSEELWQKILSASKEERAILLEENIESNLARSFLATNSESLLPEDRDRQ